MRNTFIFWTFISKELSDLKTVFESLHDNITLDRDYEDTWEWLEVKSSDNFYDINISRKHNWEIGEYKNELVIVIKTDIDLNIDEMGINLNKKLKSTIYYGNRTYVSGTDYKFEIIREYK